MLRKRPLELPLSAVLRLYGCRGRREERRWVVVVFVAEKVAGCGVLQLEPAAWEGCDGMDKLPARAGVCGRGWLDGHYWVGVTDTEDVVVRGVDDGVVRDADSGLVMPD